MVTTATGLQITERNLIVTGYVEPNKPRIARQVAQQLRMPFVDVAELIELRTGDSVDVIREQYGERRLKTVECEVMEEVLLHRKAVIRVSGSTLVHSEHYERLQQTSIIICLVARLDAVLQRMHMTLGARYHNPYERGAQLGNLQREWLVRKKEGLLELDFTYHDEASMIKDILNLWQEVAIERI
ncbi:MAG: shikimate kinase [Anaerolineae bacterium]|nr:shikimate kinase [Anaerolineae bacterium]